MARTQDPRPRLEARRERILARIAQENARSAGVLHRMGFGYATRAYARLKHLSSRTGDELTERLAAIEKDLTALGWRDPRQPVRVEGTEEEQLRHYCHVMGLRYEEEIIKINARQTAQSA